MWIWLCEAYEASAIPSSDPSSGQSKNFQRSVNEEIKGKKMMIQSWKRDRLEKVKKGK